MRELWDNADKIRTGPDYVNGLLATLQETLMDIDQNPKELRKLPREQRTEILKARQRMIRALADKVTVFASGHVKIEGVLDGSEAAEFRLDNPWCQRPEML